MAVGGGPPAVVLPRACGGIRLVVGVVPVTCAGIRLKVVARAGRSRLWSRGLEVLVATRWRVAGGERG